MAILTSGQYLIQKFSDCELYARVIERYNNGNYKAVVYDTLRGGKAKQSSLMNIDLWKPIDQASIPTKILFKLHNN